VLAIAKPSVEVTLVEPLLRRSQFLLHIKELLDLPNVVVSRARAEDVAKDMVGTFDCVTSRAVAPLDRLLSWSLPLTKPGGYVLAIKGAKAQQEVVDAAAVLGGWNCPHPRIHDVVIGLDRTRVVQVQRPVRSNSQEKKKSSRSRGGQSRRTS
jgi:16S rRNA (guanine527-N7)-methyltransferase